MVVRPTWGQAFDYWREETEVVGPAVSSGIKQRDNLSCDRIDAGQVRAFAQIATVTREGEVPGIVGPTMLAGDDVFDVMRQRTAVLREETIFARVPGTGSDKDSRRRIHEIRRRWKAAVWTSISGSPQCPQRS